MESVHIPVLLEQVLESFNTALTHRGGILLDCTLGLGGHSYALLKTYPHLSVIGIDQDKEALALAEQRLSVFGARFSARKGRYSTIVHHILNDTSLFCNIIGILADIGVSSLQLDTKERGFGFSDTRLDMRMDKERALNAKEIVNTYSLRELERILRDFGEIREYKKMARLIVEERGRAPIESARDLSALIARHFRRSGNHPATQAFQALRIAVNDELGELERLLQELYQKPLQSGARVSIIAFHSLEDRIIKRAFKEWERDCICDTEALRCVCGGNHKKGKNLTKKPQRASRQEIQSNPRSRSAKLRCFEFAG